MVWIERKGDHVYNMDDYYEGEAAKASNHFCKSISSSEVSLETPINWRNLVKLGTPFSEVPLRLP